MYFKYFFILNIFLNFACSFSISYAQSDAKKIKWLQQNSISLNPNSFDSDSVLAYFDQVFAKKEIVMLGEQNHGDGSTFLFYSQVVKLLHRRYGFEAIIFESGFYDCRKAWQKILQGEDTYSASESSVFHLWSKSRQARPLFEYIDDHVFSDNPLQLARFDCQFTGKYGREYFLPELDSIIKQIDPEYSSSVTFKNFLKIAEFAKNDRIHDFNLEDLKAFHKEISRIINLLENVVKEDERLFWQQMLKNLEISINNIHKIYNDSPNFREITNARDRQMAENVIWLLNGPLKGKKVILWGNSSHFLRNAAQLIPTTGRDLFKDAIAMGDFLKGKYQEKLYSIVSLSYQGQYGVAGNSEKQAAVLPPTGSLNHLLDLVNQPFLFFDMQRANKESHWLKTPTESRLDSSKSFKADWTKVFDGILFIDDMKPSELIEK